MRIHTSCEVPRRIADDQIVDAVAIQVAGRCEAVRRARRRIDVNLPGALETLATSFGSRDREPQLHAFRAVLARPESDASAFDQVESWRSAARCKAERPLDMRLALRNAATVVHCLHRIFERTSAVVRKDIALRAFHDSEQLPAEVASSGSHRHHPLEAMQKRGSEWR